MSELTHLRRLLSPTAGLTQTGIVTGLTDSGAVQVLAGSRVLGCTSLVPVQVGHRVRVQGLVILSKIDQRVGDVPVFRV